MKLRLGRTALYVSFAVPALIAFCIVAGEGKTLLLSVLSLAVHEAAHAIAARNAGFVISGLSVYPFGAVMRLDGVPADRDGTWTVAAAGPLCSLAVCGALKLVSPLFSDAATLGPLIRINLCIALLNALPAFPLDGGRILRAVLFRTLPERAARRTALIVTALIALGVILTGVYSAIRKTPAWALFALPPFLMIAAVKEWRRPDAGTVARVMERRSAMRMGEWQRAAITVVPETMTAGEALSALSARRYTILRVYGETGASELDEAQLMDAAAKYGMQTPLKNIILQLTDRK